MVSNSTNFTSEFLSQSIFRLQENKPRIQKCLAQLTEEQVWQKTNTSTNSIANLILHVCGNATQYIVSSLGKQPDERNRDQEFLAEKTQTKNELLHHLNATLLRVISVLETVTEEELLRERNVQGFNLSGIGIVIHVVEHFSYHTGQIALQTKLITNTDLGFYDGMDLNINNSKED